MSKLLSFAKLATGYFNGEVPESIEFSQSNALQTSVEGLVNAASIEFDTFTEKSVEAQVIDYEKMTKDRLHYDHLLRPFDDMANAFAKKLHDGITNLKQIKKDVTVLSAEVMTQYKRIVVEDPVVSAYTGEHDLSRLSMPAINWNLMNKISERVTIARVHERIGYEDDATITPALVSLALANLPGVNDERTFEPLDLKHDKVEKIIDTVFQNVKSQCTRDEVANVVKSTLFATEEHRKQAVYSLEAFADGRSAGKINNYLDHIRLDDLIFPYITDESTDVSAANRKRINHNIELIREFDQMIAYIAINYRNAVWKDAIIVPGPMVNSDRAEEFLQQGGTVSGLVQYYNYAYKETGVPAHGISMQFALEALPQATAEYRAEAARQASICEEKKKSYLRDAFIQVSLEYLNAHQDRFSKEFSKSNLPAYVASIYDSVLLEAPLENRLYDMILNSCYINSMERNLYHRLNQAYLKHANSTEALTDEMCDRIDVSVYADMIAEYLVDKGILISN